MIRTILIFLIFVLITSCASVKDGLTLKKKNSADEFLVIKKNPLVLPPDFNELPIPDEDEVRQEVLDSTNEVEELLSKNKSKTKKSKPADSSNKVEQNILKKIKIK